jgi:Flp pilus assembly protein TadG
MTARGGERGAILIHVAIALLGLTAMSAFVLDYGVMWMSRRQAQNAADAGALAGAVARGFDEVADPPSANGAVFQAATKAIAANNVWLTPPTVEPLDYVCPGFVTGGRCVTVKIHQDGTNGSTFLPTYFAPLIGITTQGTQATATAQAAVANASDCLKPWAIPDRWQEGQTPPNNSFDRYVTNGRNAGQLVPNPDVYTAPSQSGGPGTGYTVASAYGVQVLLHVGGGGNSIAPGDWMAVDLPDGNGGFNTGGANYRNAISTCSGHAVAFGDYLPIESGNMKGPTVQGVQALIDLDLSATFQNGAISNSCAPGTCADGQIHNLSPRVVAIAVYNPDKFQLGYANNNWSYCPGGGSCVQVTNILGFFVQSVDNSGNVTGYLYNYPGILKPGASSVGVGSSFNIQIQLVR